MVKNTKWHNVFLEFTDAIGAVVVARLGIVLWVCRTIPSGVVIKCFNAVFISLKQIHQEQLHRHSVAIKLRRIVVGVGWNGLIDELLHDCTQLQVAFVVFDVPKQFVLRFKIFKVWHNLLEDAVLWLLHRNITSRWLNAVGWVRYLRRAFTRH